MNLNLTPEQEATFARAAARVSHRLTFGQTSRPRQFRSGELLGPPVPDAFREGETQVGEWQQSPEFSMNGQMLEEPTEAHWFAHFLSMAVQEAVHEALEHFQVDGKPYLNPHGTNEEMIYIIVNEVTSQLAEMAEQERG